MVWYGSLFAFPDRLCARSWSQTTPHCALNHEQSAVLGCEVSRSRCVTSKRLVSNRLNTPWYGSLFVFPGRLCALSWAQTTSHGGPNQKQTAGLGCEVSCSRCVTSKRLGQQQPAHPGTGRFLPFPTDSARALGLKRRPTVLSITNRSSGPLETGGAKVVLSGRHGLPVKTPCFGRL